MVNEQMPHSSLHCDLSDSDKNILFFSLVDYRNNYFTSNEPDKIIEFYKGFENREQLIQWMKERPKGIYTIYEVDGNKDVIVVIPTADFNGKYAKECRDNIFKGLHIIFVESGGREDFYFNFAHNVNVGIRKAMEYNPKWVVVSNDDMEKVDDTYILIHNLLNSDNSKLDALFGTRIAKSIKSPYFVLSQYNKLYPIAQRIVKGREGIIFLSLLKKFHIKYLPVPQNSIYSCLFYSGEKIIRLNDFVILSGNFLKNRSSNIFDDVYINDTEDTDLAIELHYNFRTKIIPYKIRSIGGATIGTNLRGLKGLASLAYFNKKYEKLSMSFSKTPDRNFFS